MQDYSDWLTIATDAMRPNTRERVADAFGFESATCAELNINQTLGGMLQCPSELFCIWKTHLFASITIRIDIQYPHFAKWRIGEPKHAEGFLGRFNTLWQLYTEALPDITSWHECGTVDDFVKAFELAKQYMLMLYVHPDRDRLANDIRWKWMHGSDPMTWKFKASNVSFGSLKYDPKPLGLVTTT